MQKEKGRGKKKGKKNQGLYDKSINRLFVVTFFSSFIHILGCTLRFKSLGNDTSIKHAIQ
jgi:hypothetical protein